MTPKTDNERFRNRQRLGFTLMEVLVAAAILGAAFVSVTNAMSAASSSRAALQDPDQFTATQLAREIHVLADSLTREPSGTTGVTSAASVVALDSLIGASFSPPIRANLSTDTSLTGWTQAVSLTLYAVDDLTTPTGENPAVAVDPHANRLFLLSVLVTRDSGETDDYRWWLTP